MSSFDRPPLGYFRVRGSQGWLRSAPNPLDKKMRKLKEQNDNLLNEIESIKSMILGMQSDRDTNIQ